MSEEDQFCGLNEKKLVATNIIRKQVGTEYLSKKYSNLSLGGNVVMEGNDTIYGLKIAQYTINFRYFAISNFSRRQYVHIYCTNQATSSDG